MSYEVFEVQDEGLKHVAVVESMSEASLILYQDARPLEVYDTETEEQVSREQLASSLAIAVAREAQRNRPSADAAARAQRMEIKALALADVERAAAKVKAARTELDRAMSYAHSVRCSLRQIGEAADMSWNNANRRIKMMSEP